jgi:uncharacterized membrane protein
MRHLLPTLFSAVCGENPAHIWSPGGQPLPCCERCTGLYAGALIAGALQLWFRPAINQRFLQLHALCLLQLGWFVFPWLPQSAALRTISGALFGFGVVAFLWTAISDWSPLTKESRFGTEAYAIGLAGCMVLIPAIAEWGGRNGWFVLVCLVVAGAMALAVLASVNVVRCLRVLWRSVEKNVKAAEVRSEA